MITLMNTDTHKMETAGRLKNEAEKAIDWRNSELYATDWIVPIADHPQHSDYLLYRQDLRDWPQSAGFPAENKPALD